MNSAFIVAFTLAALFSTTATKAEKLSGIPSIVDGDTIDLQAIRIRLHGIDAPEAGQKCNEAPRGTWQCGEAAMDRLEELAKGRVTCRGHEYDDYGRLIATCYRSDGTDINKTLVAEGLAWAFRKYSEDYAAEEDQARSQKIGIWQADTQTAWDYRTAKWQVAEQESPDGCPIKGNISKGGQIYHAPWSPWYNKTKVSLEKGERWFCTEREAIDAGWRAPVWR
ncbi:thermonuclease family protein [Pseudorhizobium flavum]|uniref:thermonuclease family protein n=1 Tax=Pseudorhizobium flavum TaxID=1335061 RepID=UPI00376FAB86